MTYLVKHNLGRGVPQSLLSESLQRAAKKRKMSVDQLKEVEEGSKRRKLHDDISIIGIKLDNQFQQAN